MAEENQQQINEYLDRVYNQMKDTLTNYFWPTFTDIKSRNMDSGLLINEDGNGFSFILDDETFTCTFVKQSDDAKNYAVAKFKCMVNMHSIPLLVGYAFIPRDYTEEWLYYSRSTNINNVFENRKSDEWIKENKFTVTVADKIIRNVFR